MNSVFVNSELVHGSPEWKAARQAFIGASEIGSIMQLSPYTPAAKTFYVKLGLMPEEEITNEAVHWGHSLESLIAEAWQYHTGEDKSYLKKVVQRYCKPVKGYFTIKEYPFIASTPDRMFSGFKLKYDTDGNMEHIKTDLNFPLEIKSISKYSADQWESGIPIYFLAQIHGQMMTTGTDYAELAMLIDGRDLQIYPIYRSKELCELIIAKCVDFWDKVTKAKELMKDGITEEIMSKLSSLEPAPEATPAYLDFVKAKFKVDVEKKRVATPEEEQLMFSYLRALEMEGQAAESKLDARNKLLRLAEDYSQLSTSKVKMVNLPVSADRAKPYFSIKPVKQK
jgi:putative phage-type endonuclease